MTTLNRSAQELRRHFHLKRRVYLTDFEEFVQEQNEFMELMKAFNGLYNAAKALSQGNRMNSALDALFEKVDEIDHIREKTRKVQ
jgi:ABC-type uncharacterized transport system ATPase subunit